MAALCIERGHECFGKSFCVNAPNMIGFPSHAPDVNCLKR